MEKICRNKNFISIFLSVVLSFAFVAVAAYATTIGTNISTTGTMGVASTSPYVALGVTGTTTSSAGMVIGSGGTALNQVLAGTCTVNPQDGPLAEAAATTTTCTATGVVSGDKVFITPANLPAGLFLVSASSTAADTIQVSIGATSSTSPSLTTYASWSWMAIR